MSKDFRGSSSHRQLFPPHWVPLAWHSHWVNEKGKLTSQKPLTAEVSAKQSIKCQLHTTHVGAVHWESHSSSTMTCIGKMDHELPVNQSKGHTYTNPWPSLTYTHSHITRAVTAMGSCFRPYWGSSSWHSHRSVKGENPCMKTLSCCPLSPSSTQNMWKLLAVNRMAILPLHAWERQIMGLVYVCPLL